MLLHVLEWFFGVWLLTRLGSGSWPALYRRLPRQILAWSVLVWALPPRLERQLVVLAVFAVVVFVLALNRPPAKRKGGTQRLAPREPGPSDLIEAAEAGDISAVKHLLSHGADVHVRNADGESALHVAARGGHATIIDLLAAAGGDLQGRNRQDKTPLQVAEEAGHHAVAEVIRRLVEGTASIPPSRSGVPPVQVVPGVASVATAKLTGERETAALENAWEKAQEEVKAGRLEAAVPLLERASEQKAGEIAVWMLKGQVLARLNRFQEALRSFDQAVALESENVAALKAKGLCLMQLGQATAALVFFERAQAKAENDAAVWLCEAEAHEELEHAEDAVRCYDKVLELEPDHASALEQKAACLADAGRLEEAVVLSKKSVERHPQDAAAWYLRGILLDWMGNTEGSNHALEEAQKLGMSGDVNLLDLRRRWTDPLPRL